MTLGALRTAGPDMPFAPPGRGRTSRLPGRKDGDFAWIRRAAHRGRACPSLAPGLGRCGDSWPQSSCRYPHRHDQELLLDPARRGQPPSRDV